MYAWHDHHTPARVEETPVGIHKADLDVNCYDVISCVPSCHHQTNSACQDMRGKKCNCGEDIRSTSILRSSHLNMAVIWIHDSIKTSKHQPTNHRWVKTRLGHRALRPPSATVTRLDFRAEAHQRHFAISPPRGRSRNSESFRFVVKSEGRESTNDSATACKPAASGLVCDRRRRRSSRSAAKVEPAADDRRRLYCGRNTVGGEI
jgi:hypothetical protein